MIRPAPGVLDRRNFVLRTLAAAGVSALMPRLSGAQPSGGTPLPPVPAAPNFSELLALEDVEALARRIMSPPALAYVSGGAADELTTRWNHERYNDLKLQARTLVDLTGLDCSTTLMGVKMPFPILLAPTATQKVSHPEGELATARGAGAIGATMVLSSGSNTSIEDVMKAATSPIWFQLYVPKDRGFAQALAQRAEAAGARALVITVDNPVNGMRNREQRTKYSLPPGVTYPHNVGMGDPRSIVTLDRVVPARLLWSDIEWFRSIVKIPVWVKGITSPLDAELALKAGVAGIMVSNHGGRELDTQPATIEVLPRIVAKVAGRVPVLVDGGIRRGTDIVKAIALGANAVMIGRPYVYGLAAGGADGVTHVLKILRQELLLSMALLGRPTIASIDRSVIWE